MCILQEQYVMTKESFASLNSQFQDHNKAIQEVVETQTFCVVQLNKLANVAERLSQLKQWQDQHVETLGNK